MKTLAFAIAFLAFGAVASGGDISFMHAPQRGSGLGPQDAVIADVDGDGLADIITVNIEDQESGSISVMRNLGAGEFAPPVNYPTGEAPKMLAVGDLTGNGRPDLVVPNYLSGNSGAGQSTVSVLRNNGSGVYTRQNYNVGENSHPTSAVIADFNGDGHLDFAVAASVGDRIYVFRNNGTGMFNLQSTVSLSSPTHLAAADFNNDGIIDIVCANDNAVFMLRNTGAGFANLASYSISPYAISGIVAGDFDGDGFADFAITSRLMHVYRNGGNGLNFTRTDYLTGNSAQAIRAADFDGDGYLDLAVSNYLANSVGVYHNDGKGGFGAPAMWGVGRNPSGLGVGDLNGDGLIDIVAPNSQIFQTEVSVLKNLGQGRFHARRDYALARDGTDVAVADFNGDGLPDVVASVYVSNQDNLTILFGQSDGTLGEGVIIENFGNNIPTGVAVADLNGDGWPDIVASIFSPGNRIRVFINQGNGTFFPSVSYAADGNPADVAIADLNGDGHPDIVCVNGAQLSNTISVYFNLGNGTFEPQVQYSTLLRPDSVAIADVTGDGHNDVVITHSGNSNLLVFRNNGVGTLSPEAVWVGGAQTDPVLADFDDDGDLDIAVATGVITLLRNNGSGNFDPPENSSVPAGRIAAADFDDDGITDLAATASVASLVHIAGNNGAGVFIDAGSILVGYSPGKLIAGDLNGDGLPEVITANSTGGSVTVLENVTDVFTRVTPSSFTLSRGILVAGNLASLFHSDDNRLAVRPGIVLSSGEAPVSLIVEGTVPSGPISSLSVVVESSASVPNISQTVEAFNFTTGQFEVIFTGTMSTSDYSTSIPLAPANFVGPSGQMRVRMRCRQLGPVLSFPWFARFDEITWRVRK